LFVTLVVTHWIEYMKKDIYLLGGIMLKAQEIYWKEYQISISKRITLSSLALTLFRLAYYAEETTPISIPSSNADQFIRRGYYVRWSCLRYSLG